MTPTITITPDILLKRFQAIRLQTERLIAPLTPEDTVVQPIVDVSPPKWHMGHTTWFFEEFVLSANKPGYERFHPRYAYLFNSYYEGAGERVKRAYRGNMTRPTKDEIIEYRHFVDEQMRQFLSKGEGVTPELLTLIELGLNHEQQHQELLVYDVKYILGHNPLFPEYRTDLPLQSSGPALLDEAWLDVEEGLYEVGHAGEGFHWDNEEGRHRVFLESYRIQDRLITYGEFREFVDSGAYHDYRWWLEEGWRWVNEQEVDTPFYWFMIDGTWYHITLQGLQPIDWDLPMTHVNYYEADAYARWKGKRLPTEFEWEVACGKYSPEVPQTANFVEKELFGTQRRQGNDHQFYGDVWEWTSSAYLPYPHYQAPEGTVGEYNGKFMINQMVLRGGSCATPRDHIRLTYRNFFHPHLQWLFNGFRLAEYR